MKFEFQSSCKGNRVEMHISQMPDRDEMLRRLKEVKDGAYLVEYFYPYILQIAGQEKTGDAVVRAIALAWDDVKKVTNPVISMAIRPYFQAWVEALIDNPKAKAVARQMMKDTMPKLYKE